MNFELFFFFCLHRRFAFTIDTYSPMVVVHSPLLSFRRLDLDGGVGFDYVLSLLVNPYRSKPVAYQVLVVLAFHHLLFALLLNRLLISLGLAFDFI